MASRLVDFNNQKIEPKKKQNWEIVHKRIAVVKVNGRAKAKIRGMDR